MYDRSSIPAVLAGFLLLAGLPALPLVISWSFAGMQSTMQEAVPPSDASTDPAPFDWGAAATGFGIVLAVVAGLALLVGAVVIVRRARRSRRALIAARAERARRWGEALASWNRLCVEVATVEADPRSILDRPKLLDLNEATTANFWRAFVDAQQQVSDTAPHSDQEIDRFSRTMQTAHRAWEVAQRSAHDADEKADDEQTETSPGARPALIRRRLVAGVSRLRPHPSESRTNSRQWQAPRR